MTSASATLFDTSDFLVKAAGELSQMASGRQFDRAADGWAEIGQRLRSTAVDAATVEQVSGEIASAIAAFERDAPTDSEIAAAKSSAEIAEKYRSEDSAKRAYDHWQDLVARRSKAEAALRRALQSVLAKLGATGNTERAGDDMNLPGATPPGTKPEGKTPVTPTPPPADRKPIRSPIGKSPAPETKLTTSAPDARDPAELLRSLAQPQQAAPAQPQQQAPAPVAPAAAAGAPAPTAAKPANGKSDQRPLGDDLVRELLDDTAAPVAAAAVPARVTATAPAAPIPAPQLGPGTITDATAKGDVSGRSESTKLSGAHAINATNAAATDPARAGHGAPVGSPMPPIGMGGGGAGSPGTVNKNQIRAAKTVDATALHEPGVVKSATLWRGDVKIAEAEMDTKK